MEYIIRIDEIKDNAITKSEIQEEIIRCRDCKKHHKPSGICSYWSTYDADVSTDDDGFCAWAERVD